MPWSLSQREGKWCVVKADGEVAGCHESRTDAIKQQRALYANESRVAALYAELDALPVQEFVPHTPSLADFLGNHELVKVVVGSEQDKALTASVVQALEITNQRLESTEQMTHALAAALQSLSERDNVAPVVNVEAPNVTMEPRFEIPAPIVNVEPAQITVTTPEVHVPAPQVTVNMPERSKTITFERDFDGRVTKADVVEGSEQPRPTT